MSLTGKPLPSDPPPWLICQFRAATMPKGSVVGVGRCKSPSTEQANISNLGKRHRAAGTLREHPQGWHRIIRQY